jgi:hypothetical protein
MQGLAELPHVHRRRTDVADLPCLDYVVQGFEGFLKWRSCVHSVDLAEVDVIGAEPAKTVIDLTQNGFSREPGPVRTWSHRMSDFCRNDNVIAIGEIRQRTAEDFFARSSGVHVGRVEEVDPDVQRVLDERGQQLQSPDPC